MIHHLLGLALRATKPKDPAKRSPHWRAIRAAHLVHERTCAACGGAKLLEVHHVKPFHLFPALELVDANLITLCESSAHNCHLIFGHLLNWAAYNPAVREDAAKLLEKIAHRLVA